jgi:hypothetical protein
MFIFLTLSFTHFSLGVLLLGRPLPCCDKYDKTYPSFYKFPIKCGLPHKVDLHLPPGMLNACAPHILSWPLSTQTVDTPYLLRLSPPSLDLKEKKVLSLTHRK